MISDYSATKYSLLTLNLSVISPIKSLTLSYRYSNPNLCSNMLPSLSCKLIKKPKSSSL